MKKRNEGKPEPGQYDPSISFTKLKSVAWGFGTSTRPMTLNKSSSIPGPDLYNIPSKVIEGPKFVIGVRPNTSMNAQRDQIPGPGKYNQDNLIIIKQKQQPAFSIGKSRRADIANLKEKLNNPGPGQYQTLDDAALKKHAPKYAFGTSS